MELISKRVFTFNNRFGDNQIQNHTTYHHPSCWNPPHRTCWSQNCCCLHLSQSPPWLHPPDDTAASPETNPDHSKSIATAARQCQPQPHNSHHRLNGSSSPVLTATSLSYERTKNSTPTESKRPNPIEIKFGMVDYVNKRTRRAKFHAKRASPQMGEIYAKNFYL